MHAEIVVTGSEILLGKLVDTNSAHIANQLAPLGIPLAYITAVGDDEERVTEALRIALGRAPLIITTGGLGPTVDDVTREAVAAATGRPLVFHADLLEQIDAFFRRLGREMSPNNRKQAFVPEGALPIENPVGTAPAYIVETEAGAVISLPGVPREMYYMLEHNVLPYLWRRFGAGQVMRSRTLHTAGMGESVLDSTLGDELLRTTNPLVGLNARAGQVDVRLTATARDEAACLALIAPLEAEIRSKLGIAVYGTDEDSLEGIVLTRLSAEGVMLATAEAGTRGQLAGRLAGTAGAETYLGGLVQPSPGALCAALGVTPPPASEGRTRDADETLARALAAALRDSTGAAAALILLAHAEPLRIILGLDGPAGASARVLPYGSRPDFVGDWGASAALDWLRRKLG
jgi:nicotinamide-nucleotide amidase